MRFISYATAAGPGIGLRCDDGYRGASVLEIGRELSDVIGDGSEAVRRLADRLAMAPRLEAEALKLLPAIPKPDKIFCIGLNYRHHAEETGQEIPPYPVVFCRYPTSVVGAGAALIQPRASSRLDYEAELAVVIGTPGRHIPKARALEHVAGYAAFNDGSVRDYQFKSSQWVIGKTFDRTGSFGPELVTPDELPPGAAGLKIEARVNGETVQSDNTADLIFDVATLIEVLSEAVTLAPGDVIVTGTPGGVGMARNPRLWLKPGDLCEIEIEGVGLLANRVEAEAAS
jgi:2-keto-4-pentenoate hydratase/2-oxohepta-3-ene-1,7-dioic acid hydratase in catechol pathway